MKHTHLHGLPRETVSHNPEIVKRVMLRNGDVPNVTQFAQACFAPGQVAPAHAHSDMAEVFFVESGEGTIEIDGTPHRLTPGACYAIVPGEKHEVRNDGVADLVLTYFGVRV